MYRIFCTGNISQCTSGHLFIRSPALGVDTLREEPMTSEEKEYMEMEGSPASPTQIVRAHMLRENTGYMRDYVLNENGDIKELYFHQITNKET